MRREEATRRRPDYEVKVILSVIGCLKSGKKNFKDDLKTLFKNEKELKQTIGEMKNYTHVNKMGHTSEFLFSKKQLFIKKNLLKWANKKYKNLKTYNAVFF